MPGGGMVNVTSLGNTKGRLHFILSAARASRPAAEASTHGLRTYKAGFAGNVFASRNVIYKGP